MRVDFRIYSIVLPLDKIYNNVEIPENLSAVGAIRHLIREFGDKEAETAFFPDQHTFIVNNKIVDKDTLLNDGDRVSILKVIAGG